MKKGEVNAQAWMIVAVIIAVITLIAVWKYPGKLFAPLIDDVTENVHSEQQFAVFVEKLRDMKDGEKFTKLYGVGKGYVVVGFLKGKQMLGGETCSYLGGKKIELAEEIIKPKECGDKACLCLCKGKLDGACQEQGSYFCQQLDVAVRDDLNSCGYLIVEPSFGNVYVKREQNFVYVNLERGGKGSA